MCHTSLHTHCCRRHMFIGRSTDVGGHAPHRATPASSWRGHLKQENLLLTGGAYSAPTDRLTCGGLAVPCPRTLPQITALHASPLTRNMGLDHSGLDLPVHIMWHLPVTLSVCLSVTLSALYNIIHEYQQSSE